MLSYRGVPVSSSKTPIDGKEKKNGKIKFSQDELGALYVLVQAGKNIENHIVRELGVDVPQLLEAARQHAE